MDNTKLIELLAAQITARGLDPMSDEQLALLESDSRADRAEREWMLEDMRDRVGLSIPDEFFSVVDDDERSDGPNR